MVWCVCLCVWANECGGKGLCMCRMHLMDLHIDPSTTFYLASTVGTPRDLVPTGEVHRSSHFAQCLAVHLDGFTGHDDHENA